MIVSQRGLTNPLCYAEFRWAVGPALLFSICCDSALDAANPICVLGPDPEDYREGKTGFAKVSQNKTQIFCDY